MVTVFGKELRKIRLDNDELLKDMATKLDITAAYLSSIENGKKKPTAVFANKICQEYSLSDDAARDLMDAYYRTVEEIAIDAQNMTTKQFDMSLVLARKLNELDSDQIDSILKILNK